MSVITDAHARHITSFKKSDALLNLTQFMYEVGPDMAENVRLSDRKVSVIRFEECSIVTSDDVLDLTARYIKKVIRYYPDEDIPFEEALMDLENYLDYREYHKCLIEKRHKNSKVESIYFADKSNKIHLRIDKITPILE